MIPLIPMVISAIPSIVKLFSSDDRKEGVSELTSTIVKEAGKKLGVDFKTKEDVVNHLSSNPEDAIKLREIETTHLENISKLELDSKKEDNRHEEHFVNKQVADTSDARDMFKHGSELQTKTAHQVMTQTSWMIPSLILLDVVVLVYADDLGTGVAPALTGIISATLMHLYNERKQLLSFLFGAMIAKVKKK